MEASTLLGAVTDGISTVIGWVGTVISSLLGADGELAELRPLFAIGISISAILLGRCFIMPSLNRAKSVKAKALPC